MMMVIVISSVNGMAITKGNVFPFFTSIFQTAGTPVSFLAPVGCYAA
jgi:hypothetical protein